MESSDAGQVTVVEEGSEDDPFKANPTDQPATKPDDNQSQPDADKDTPAPDVDDEGVKFLTDLETAIQARVAKAHSGLDKRVAALQKDNEGLVQSLDEQKRTLREAERRARSEGLSDEEKAAAQDKWALDDEKELLVKKSGAVDQYFRQVRAYDLVNRYEKFGLTAEHLEEATSTDEMDLIAEKVRGDFLETGEKPKPPEDTPAGAKAKTDLGGSPVPDAPYKLGEEQGVEGMAANVKNLFRQPGNVK